MHSPRLRRPNFLLARFATIRDETSAQIVTAKAFTTSWEVKPSSALAAKGEAMLCAGLVLTGMTKILMTSRPFGK